jgi:hypothetical protein
LEYFPGATYLINYRKVGGDNLAEYNKYNKLSNPVQLEDETNYEAQVATVVNTVLRTFSSNMPSKQKD